MNDVVRIRDFRIQIPTDERVVRAVDGVSLSVQAGEILAIVGESGSGKTLTARAIMGFLPPRAEASGSILVSGREVLTANAQTLHEIRGLDCAMVFQEPSAALNPVFPIGWQISEGLRAHGIKGATERRRRAIEILTAVGIPQPEERIDHYPHQFSGGQKQRIIIAMAIAMRPKLIIADEPTTALDVTVQAEILDLFRYCRDTVGSAIVLITHNIGIVADLADRVIVMRQGKLVEEAPVQKLFDAPEHDYTQTLLKAVPKLGFAPQRPPIPANAPPAMDVEGLQVTYGGRDGYHAVREVSFRIAAGEVLGLVGESGSGKSTIAKTIVGLAPISRGRIALAGSDLAKARGKALRNLRRSVGFVHQDPVSSFNQHFTVFECIAEPIRVHRALPDEAAVRKRVFELLDQVHLPRDFAERRPFELSGGQRQRVGIARALALKPSFIVADEPTSALDVSVQSKVLALFAELQRELGFASLFISHDLAVVEEVSDRVGVLSTGKLVEIGPAKEVLLNPHHSYTRNLISSVPIPDPARQRARRLARVAK